MAVDLGKQIGPLPLGAWIVVVGAGVGIMLWQRQASTGTEEPQEDVGAPDGVGEGGGPGWVDLNPPPPQTQPEITDNAAWLAAAANGLIGMGFPADVVVSALNKGINGEAMSLQEAALWRMALTRYGVPPEGIMPGPTPPPVPNPNPGPQPNPTQPPRVLGLVVDPFGVRARSAVLRWAGLPNWWNYRIYRLINGAPRLVANVTASSGNVPIVSYELKNLAPNTAYTNFFVVAVNAAGRQGPWSNRVSFRTKAR